MKGGDLRCTKGVWWRLTNVLAMETKNITSKKPLCWVLQDSGQLVRSWGVGSRASGERGENVWDGREAVGERLAHGRLQESKMSLNFLMRKAFLKMIVLLFNINYSGHYFRNIFKAWNSKVKWWMERILQKWPGMGFRLG